MLSVRVFALAVDSSAMGDFHVELESMMVNEVGELISKAEDITVTCRG